MSNWSLHWLAASSDLEPWREQIVAEIDAAHAVISEVVTPPTVDILLALRPEEVIPETGNGAHALHKSLFSLSFDPANPNFERSLANGDIRRGVAHEAHHCLRMAGPGYGQTLGEALVSEGLAGRFVTHLFQSAPDPWECAVDQAKLMTNRPDVEMLMSATYDHAAWFYGVGGTYPRWLGYTMGYELVGKWLAVTGALDGQAWVNVPALNVLAATWPEIEHRAD